MTSKFVEGKGAITVYTPDVAVVDICFVHGLGGERTSTWKMGEVFWPYNLLAKDIKDARIITWGYLADVGHFLKPLPYNEVKDHAKGLSTALSLLRDSQETKDRPIIFVAHSLGGIVSAQSLLPNTTMESKEAQQIARKIFGLAFIGTPFEGSKIAGWASFFEKLSRLLHLGTLDKKLLGHLQEDSHELRKLCADFSMWLSNPQRSKEESIRVKTFHENLPFPGVGLIVSPESSQLVGWPSLTLHGDHINICKFDNFEDPNYKQVLSVLKEWVEELKSSSKKAGHLAFILVTPTSRVRTMEAHKQETTSPETK